MMLQQIVLWLEPNRWKLKYFLGLFELTTSSFRALGILEWSNNRKNGNYTEEANYEAYNKLAMQQIKLFSP